MHDRAATKVQRCRKPMYEPKVGSIVRQSRKRSYPAMRSRLAFRSYRVAAPAGTSEKSQPIEEGDGVPLNCLANLRPEHN